MDLFFLVLAPMKEERITVCRLEDRLRLLHNVDVLSRPKVRFAEHISYAFGGFMSVRLVLYIFSSSSSVPELRIQVLMLQFLQRDASGCFLCIPIMQSSIFSR